MYRFRSSVLVLTLFVVAICVHVAGAREPAAEVPSIDVPDLPDPELVETYRHAASDNVLAAVNPQVFVGYFSVCADGQGFGYGNSYPSLDGHQMSAALLWLNQVETVKANWEYVRTFQRSNGQLPLAILPALAGQRIGVEPAMSTVDANGGLYEHWVPGNPLAALASPTFIQNADVIYRHTLDRDWLAANLDRVNLSADYLTSLANTCGLIEGAGYYIERPVRIAADGVAQCHAIDAFRRVAALNRVLSRDGAAERYEALARRTADRFVTDFWAEDHFAEYWHPARGFITSHGLTDVDWAALAMDVATPSQQARLWPALRTGASAFYYGGMPTGISTHPERYEDWEFTHPDRHDLAAMGRVWYVECWARCRLGDAAGLLDTLHRVAREGKRSGYSWRERYYPTDGDVPVPAGAEKYCEYPANFVRIVNQFLLGVDLRLDGTIVLAPRVPDDYWARGFGHVVRARGALVRYHLQRDRIAISSVGPREVKLGLCLPAGAAPHAWRTVASTAGCSVQGDERILWLTLPPAAAETPCQISLAR
jgi:hypothetical protein